jgi:prophage tail gpP-like protein
MLFDPRMVCKLTVGGGDYTDWETIWVQERWTEAFTFFRFTANEGKNLPSDWHRLMIKPGDSCTVTLGGALAATGRIVTRQCSYNATQHMVQLTGKALSYWPYKSSVDTKDGNFDGMHVKQIATKVLQEYGAPKFYGNISEIPWQELQAQKGIKIWDFLEGLCRQRKVVLGSDRKGNCLLVGDHSGSIMTGSTGNLIEGANIKAMQCTISVDDMYIDLRVDGSTKGSDQQNGSDTNEQSAPAKSKAPVASKLVIPNEDSVATQAELDLRVVAEKQWTEATQITANVTVVGWFNDQGQLWSAGDDAYIYSPMAMLDGTMKIKTVTWTQDNNQGTQTTLELVAPWGLNDTIGANVGNAGMPQLSDSKGN